MISINKFKLPKTIKPESIPTTNIHNPYSNFIPFPIANNKKCSKQKTTQMQKLQNKENPIEKREKREMGYLFFSTKVPDLDGLAGVGDTGIDGEMSINEPHLVSVTLGDTGDEILDVAERGADGGGGLPGAEPSIDLQLSLPSFLVSNEIEIQVQVLEISDELATWAFHLDDLSVHLNLDPIWDVHRLR